MSKPTDVPPTDVPPTDVPPTDVPRIDVPRIDVPRIGRPLACVWRASSAGVAWECQLQVESVGEIGIFTGISTNRYIY